MKRPLAVFGLATLVWLLVALRLPAAFAVGAGVFAAAALAGCLVWRRALQAGGPAPLRPAVPTLAVLAAALALAVGLRFAGDYFWARPVAALAGTGAQARVRVLATEPGYGEDTVHATVRVLQLDGEAPARSFKVKLNGLPKAEVGDLLALPVNFFDFGTTQTSATNYAKGIYVGASPAGDARVVGSSHTIVTRLRAWQYAASANIRARLPLRLSSVAAAMTVGDRRFIPYEVTEAYRAAGISHLLVVSGLHLSLLCGFLRKLLAALLRSRPRLAGAVGIAFVLFFMAFTGLAPSVVRSGVVWLMVFAAEIVRRDADTFTSLGAAALALVLANPYAAADVGLLLSFTATLGALASGGVYRALRRALLARKGVPVGEAKADKNTALKPWWQRAARTAGRYVAGAATTSLCVTLATLPVLVYAGMGLSLLSLPMNVLVVPFLTPVVLCGLLMALPPAVPVLGWPGLGASALAGGLLNAMERLATLCAGAGWAYLPLGGMFGLVVVGAVYALAFTAHKTRRVAACALAAALLLAGAGALHATLNTGTVKATVAGSGAQSSLVVSQNGQAVVLYRSRQSAWAVRRTLRQNRAECVLLIDLRRTAESTEYEEMFTPQKTVLAEEELLSAAEYAPLDDVTVQVARQGGGTVACVDVAGYKIGLCAGSANLESYAALDVLVAGSGAVQGDYALLLAGATVPDWAAPNAEIYHTDGDALIWLRPGASALLREVRSAADG